MGAVSGLGAQVGGALQGAAGALPGTLGPVLGGMAGTAGGVMGTGIRGPQDASIQQGVTPEQVQQGYAGAQNGLAQQQALLNALQGQNGIGNQTSVFNQGQGLANQLAGANAVGNQSGALQAQQALAGQQQATAQQYQNIANGTGPNPAQAALNNATGQNVANQAALMAGQRGAGANVGLMARQAAQQGAATQQQAVGQSAQMQAQQQLAGLSGLSAQQQAIGATNQNVAGIAGQQLGAQQAQQQGLANQANTQANQQIGATTAVNQGQQNEQGTLLGANNAQNNASVGSQGNVNSSNTAIAGTVAQGQQSMYGGFINKGLGPATSLVTGGGAEGGQVVALAPGGAVTPMMAPAPLPPPGPASSFGQFLTGWNGGGESGGSAPGAEFVDMRPGYNQGAEDIKKAFEPKSPIPKNPLEPTGPGEAMAGPDAAGSAAPSLLGEAAPLALAAARGGLVKALLSEKEVVVPPNIANSPDKSAAYVGQMKSSGGGIKAANPAQKAVKKGNSYDNDKIPKELPEGAIVIPRSVMESKNPERSAHDFVSKVLAKRGRAS